MAGRPGAGRSGRGAGSAGCRKRNTPRPASGHTRHSSRVGGTVSTLETLAPSEEARRSPGRSTIVAPKALERGRRRRRKERLGPRRRTEQPAIGAARPDQLQSQREAGRPEAGRDDDRGRADERPPRAEAWVAGRLRFRRLADRGDREDRVVLSGPIVERGNEPLALCDRPVVLALRDAFPAGEERS